MPNDVRDAQDRGDPDQPGQRLLEVEFLQAPVLGFSEIAWLMKYDTPDMKSIRNRMAKIQTISLACRSTCSSGRPA